MRYHHTFYTSHLFHCGWRTLTTRDARASSSSSGGRAEPVYLLVSSAAARQRRRRRINDADRVRRRCRCHIVPLRWWGRTGGEGEASGRWGWWWFFRWRTGACVLHVDAGEWKNNTGPSAPKRGRLKMCFFVFCFVVNVCVGESLCVYEWLIVL